ncbi:hypothetical protein ACFY12_28775 [Streptomyces sp. NPDC001339]|uniref:hypothetical protein n=1 Tax=Streptomyces sp. NPDC001339 TaxID=3364563 RepID=UPI0036C6C1AA
MTEGGFVSARPRALVPTLVPTLALVPSLALALALVLARKNLRAGAADLRHFTHRGDTMTYGQKLPGNGHPGTASLVPAKICAATGTPGRPDRSRRNP